MNHTEAWRLLGDDPCFENFWVFVETEIKPYLDFELIQETWYKEVIDCWIHNRESLTLISRGHGKTQLGLFYTMFVTVCQPINPFSEKPMLRRTIITNQIPLIYSELQKMFFNNPRLRNLMPMSIKKMEESNKLWNQEIMQLRNGSVIYFREIGSKKIRGTHPDSAWVDDLVTERPSILDKDLINLFTGAVHGTLGARKAPIQVTGTTLRHSDLHQHIMKNIPTYKVILKPAIVDGQPLSPRFTMEELDRIKRRDGSVRFSCEYLLNPLDDGTSLIRREWVQNCGLKSKIMVDSMELIRQHKIFNREEFSGIYLGVDFAFSDRLTADKSAFVIIGETKLYNTISKIHEKLYTIIDIQTKKGMSGEEQIAFMHDLNAVYQFDLIGLEENSIKAVSADWRKHNLPLKFFWTGTRDEKGDKAPEKNTITIGKVNLVLRMGTFFENKTIVIPSGDEYSIKIFYDLLEECLSFAKEGEKLVEQGVHPDIPIALGYALEVATRWNASFVI